MQTTTERPARGAGATKSKPATNHRKREKRTGDSPTASKGRYRKTDVEPDEFFKAWSREQREALIEILIGTLDALDGDTDLEPDLTGYSPGMDSREGDEGEDEPSLGFQAGDIFVGRGCEHGGSGDDREVEDEHDEDNNDREGDELEHGGDEHDGAEPDEDGEPSLGWTENVCQTVPNTGGPSCDYELSGSYVTEAARQRYEGRFTADRYAKDGKHVDTERCFDLSKRRLTNLSDQQRAAVAPRLDREEVRL